MPNIQNKNYLLSLEQQWFTPFSSILSTTTISGFVTYLISSTAPWQQWTYLLHTFLGVLLSLLFFPYIIFHFKRTLGSRRTIVIIVGYAIANTLVILTASGLHIAIYGQAAKFRWIYSTHIIASLLLLATAAFHLLTHLSSNSARRKYKEEGLFPSFTIHTRYANISALLGTTTLTIILSAGYALNSGMFEIQHIWPNKQIAVGYKGETIQADDSVSNQRINQGITANAGNFSRGCSACHSEIAAEWQNSMHSKSGSNTSFRSAFSLTTTQKDRTNAKECIECHAPSSLFSDFQQLQNIAADNNKSIKGIDCVSCHWAEDQRNNKAQNKYLLSPKDDYLFSSSSNPILTRIHDYLVFIQPKQHRQNLSPKIITTRQFCLSCHIQPVNNINAGDNVSPPCQDCHMPLTTAEDPSANADGHVRSHHFIGSNNAAPWYTGNTTQYNQTNRFLQGDKIRIAIEEPNREDATRSTKHFSPTLVKDSETLAYYYIGETADLSLSVINTLIGHNFPADTTSLGEAWIELLVVDAQNKIIYQNGNLSKDNNIDKSAHFYKSSSSKHHDAILPRNLNNTDQLQNSNLLEPGKPDIVAYTFKIPAWTKSPLTISAILRYRKFDDKFARWAFKNESITSPIVDIARDAITVPVRIKREVEH